MSGAICDMAEEIIYPDTDRKYRTACCGVARHSSSVYIKRCPDGDYVFCREGQGCKR